MPFINFQILLMQTYTLLLSHTRGISKNSKDAFLKLLRGGHFKNLRDQILYILKESSKPLTRREMAHIIGCDPSSISTPVITLLREDKIISVGKRKNTDTNKVVDSFILKKEKSDEQQ